MVFLLTYIICCLFKFDYKSSNHMQERGQDIMARNNNDKHTLGIQVLLVWFVVDEYYCSETTTARVLSLGCSRHTWR